jgi:sugar/nucleoside kinase (ribokinase family)
MMFTLTLRPPKCSPPHGKEERMQVSPDIRTKRAPRGSFVGLTTVDMIFSFETYPDEDTKNTARQYTAAAGGPASNAAVVFSYLGGEAQLISSLGRSGISNVARRDLMQRGVRHVDITGGHDRDPALSAIVISERTGTRTIFTSPAIDDELPGPFSKEDTAECVAGIDILLLDGHQTSLAAHIAHQAKQNGVTVVLDGDLYSQQMGALLPLVDIVIFGKSFSVPGKRSIRDVFAYFESFGVTHVIATNGGNPIEYLSDGVSSNIDVEQVSVVDTLAAGDFFHGAFCYSYSVDRDVQRALRFAARVASKSVTTFGTRNWMSNYAPSSVE